jgi:hypothetical protein
MDIGIITLIIIIAAIAILIILIFAGFFNPIDVDSYLEKQLEDGVSLQQGFCNPTTGICDGKPVAGIRGKCQIYNTFSSEKDIVDSLPPIIEITDLPSDLKCDDGFIRALQKRSRTCYADVCMGIDGHIYKKGEVEIYYKSCFDLKPCKDPRSALIFDFDIDKAGKLSPEARCLSGNISKSGPSFFLTGCPGEVVLDNNVFLDIDTNPIKDVTEVDMMSLRIRVPGTSSCLVPTPDLGLITYPCLGRTDLGFAWVYLNGYTSRNFTTLDFAPTFKVPSQIIMASGKLPSTVEEARDYCKNYTPTSAIPDIKVQCFKFYFGGLLPYENYLDLIRDSDILKIGPPNYCTIATKEEAKKCRKDTSIVTAYSWSALF